MSGVFYGVPDIAKAGTETYNHIIPFTITDTSGTARTNVPVVITKDVNGQLIAYGLLNSTAVNSYVDSTNGETNYPVGSGTTYDFLPSDDYITVVVPSLPAFGSVTINLYTGYSPNQTVFPIITGANGNIVTADAANLEGSDNFSWSINGWVDAAVSGNYSDKPAAYRFYGDGSNNATAIIIDGDQYFVTSPFYTYTTQDASGNLTITDKRIYATMVDKDVDIWVYRDFGASYFDALSINFTLEASSSTVNGARAALWGLSNSVTDAFSFAATEPSILYDQVGATRVIKLGRGNGVISDNSSVIAHDTPYYLTVTRAAGGDTITAVIYTDAARTAVHDTLTLSGFGAAKWRYYYGFSSVNAGGVAQEFYGYSEDHTISPTLYPEQYNMLVSASGLTSGEQVIVNSIGDTPDLNTWASDANVALNMGGGIIPGFLLQEIELTAAGANITFSDIDDLITIYEGLTGTTARHLAIILNGISPDAVTSRIVALRLNNDTAANYNYQTLYGTAATPTASRTSGATSVNLLNIPGTSYPGAYGGGVVLIPNAFNTANHKSILSVNGAAEHNAGTVTARWAATAAVTRIDLIGSGGNIGANSTAQLVVIDERYNVGSATPSSANATISSISSAGSNLAIIGYPRTTRAGTSDDILLSFNGDTTAGNYNRQFVQGSGAAPSASTANDNLAGRTAGNTATANDFGAFVAFISQYNNELNDPTTLSISGHVENTVLDGAVRVVSHRRNNTQSVNSVTIAASIGSGFVDGSRFDVYRVPQHLIYRYITFDNNTHSVDFTNIPSTYKVFAVNIYGRTTAAGATDNISATINGDTTNANYDWQKLYGDGATRTAERNSGAAGSRNIFQMPASGAGANIFGSGLANFPQYAETDRHKHAIVIHGAAEDIVQLQSQRWENMNSITSLSLAPDGASDNFTSGTVIELVGMIPSTVFYTTIDGTLEGIMATANYTGMINNNNDWTLINNTIVRYADNITYSVGGTPQITYVPSVKINNASDKLTGTIPDSAGDGTSNTGNVTWGSNSNMTITGGDIIDSDSPTSVGATSTLMNSSVFDLGTYASAFASFEYGLDTNYGFFTSETSLSSNTTNGVTLTGLTPNTTYHYRALLRNGVVYSYGADTTFTTAASTSGGGSVTPIIQDLGVFQDYQSTGDMLIAAEIILTYPPYYPTDVSFKYFQMQLLDTDGTTVLAASPISQWGDRPTAIYLNPTLAATLTYGQTYTVRVSNVSSANITVNTSTNLTATDWRGNNLAELDAWCIGVATSMQSFDGTILTDPYTQSDPAYGIIITNTAGGFFVKGIPNIATVRPGLFTTSKYNQSVPTLTSTITYQSGNTSLAAGVGNTIATDMTTVGTVFNVTNQQVLIFMIFAVVIGSAIYTVSETKGFGAVGAIMLSLPLFGSAMYLNITDIQMMAIVGVIASFIFVWKFVLSRL